MKRISSGLKSSSLRKCRPLRLTGVAMVIEPIPLSLWRSRRGRSGRVADQRAGHAVAAAAALADLGAVDRQDLDPGLAHQRVGELIALVGDDHAGLEGDDVVAVVPLLALGLPRVGAGLDDPQLLELERVLDRAEEGRLLADVELALRVRRPDRVGGDRRDDLRE